MNKIPLPKTPVAIAITFVLLGLYGAWFQVNSLWSDFVLVLIALWNSFICTNDIGFLEIKKQRLLIVPPIIMSVVTSMTLSVLLRFDLLSSILIGIVFSVWMPALVYLARQEPRKRPSSFYVSGPLAVLLMNSYFFQRSLPVLVICNCVTLIYALL
ncbi:MAG: hypothetical protein HC933_08005 [Pleurocapsa sp. SU_196_0]|nr:hypothetical protein [Pleurocapsa sp. SU_196_0]